MITRRKFLGVAGATVAFRNETLSMVDRLLRGVEGVADDEDFWMGIRQAFVVDPNFVNFNNGGCCPSPRIVQDALRRQIEYANQAPSYYMWQHLEPEVEAVRRRLASSFGVDAEEIAITRNASEALENALFGFDLAPGDEILSTNLDYPRMIETIKQRERRDGVKMVQVRVPAVRTGPGDRWLTDPIERGITSRTKLILVSHVSFMNGQIFPVKAIRAMAEKRGIPLIVDGAHAFAQFPFKQPDLNCEIYGVSLHKWLMAPVGTGFLFVAKKRIEDIWSLYAAPPEQKSNIRKFEEIGTHPAANHNAIGEALTFHEMLEPSRKAARLRYLRSRWTSKIEHLPNVRFYTGLSEQDSCGLTTVGIKGIATADLHKWLFEKHGIYCTSILTPGEEGGPPLIDGLRISPSVYTIVSEVDRFGAAMLSAAERGIA